jgi:hypothetical protein
MTDFLTIILIFAAWIFITKYLFPKIGVPTWGMPYNPQCEDKDIKEEE